MEVFFGPDGQVSFKRPKYEVRFPTGEEQEQGMTEVPQELRIVIEDGE